MTNFRLKHDRENELVEYYDAHPKYHSSCEPEAMLDIFFDELAPLQLGNRSWVLDVGCGDGRMSLQLVQQYSCFVLGVDCSQKRLELANASQLGKDQGAALARYVQGDIGDPAEFARQIDGYYGGRKRFDVIMLFEVLEHLEHSRAVLDSLRKDFLKPDGKIIGSVPLRMPDVAHLHVFADERHVTEALGVSVIETRGSFAFFVA